MKTAEQHEAPKPSLPARSLISMVRIYQHTLSPLKKWLLFRAGCCRFNPTCSQYAIEALQSHGAFRGSWLALRRILRCHPWSHSGYDPVPPIK